MSEKSTDAAAPQASSTAVTFSERELSMLAWAMQSLKTGPPEIDYEKLAGFAGMGNPKSAANAWAKIKGKLFAGSEAAPPKTPKSTGRKTKAAKSAPKVDSGDDEAGSAGEAATDDAVPETPKAKKTPTPRKRKSPEKHAEGEDGPSTPVKKARAPRKTKAQKEAEAEAAKGALPDVDVAAAINDNDTEATTIKGEDVMDEEA